MARIRATSGVVRTVYRARHRAGHYVWLESASRDDGPELVAVTREIGGRLETEQRLRLVQTAVDQVRESVVITEGVVSAPGPEIVYVNPAFTRMTGYRADEIVGRTPRLLQGPATDRAVLAELRKALARGEAWEGEGINYRRDGSTYLVHWSIHPLRDAAGNISHWVSVQRDVSEQRAAENLKQIHRDELAHVTRLSTMGEMASGLAHEIKQPLTSISTYVGGLLRQMDRGVLRPEVLRDKLERVGDQADRAVQIINRLRAFVLKRGTVRAEASPNALVTETLAFLEADLKHRSVPVELALTPGLGPVRVDSVQIQQVLINLIRNAVEATEAADTADAANADTDRAGKSSSAAARSSSAAVTVATGPDGPRGVRIDVIDQGPGLSAQRLERIFEPFFTTKDDGMGMGLTISESIADAHGGRLWVAVNPLEAAPSASLCRGRRSRRLSIS